MSGIPQGNATLARSALVLLLITAAPASEAQPTAANEGSVGSTTDEQGKHPPSAADRQPTKSDPTGNSPPSREPTRDVPDVKGKPETSDEQSKQTPPPAGSPPAPDTETHASPQQPAQEVPATEGKSDTSAPGAKILKPIAPDEAVGILGKKVYGPAGEDMGMIVDVLVDGESKPRAAVIDFGGFLGVGTRKIATDWQLLQFRPSDRTQPVLLTLGQAELRAAPEYKISSQPAEIVAPSTPAETPTVPDAEK